LPAEKPFSQDVSEFPVTKVTLPVEFTKYLSLKSRSITFQKEGDRFLKYWSCLFWVKRIRAEILQTNSDDWIKLYEELVLLLENNIPASKDQDKFDDELNLNLTRFNYLMELSAVATGEASYGYAERARHLLGVIYPDNPKNEKKREPYERWIWWNMGMAYQHMGGRNQKAVLEFNRVIKEYFGKNSDIKEKKKLIVDKGSNSLEFLLNILPATLQRSAINLKQQLGYHALQTLADSDSLLDEVFQKYPDTIYSSSVSNLRQRIDLFRLDAYQQLDSSEDTKELLAKLYKEVFDEGKWSPKEPSLPPVKQKPSVAETQLVEQTVKWFLEKITGPIRCEKLIDELQEPKVDKTDAVKKKVEKIVNETNYLHKAIETVTDLYWEWAKENSFDKRIYFSRWAQFLKYGISLSYKLGKIKKHTSSEIEQSAKMLLKATIKLYQSHREKIPVRRSERDKHKGTLELERFRSDDLPDFVNGLSSFYKNMSGLLLKKEERDIGLNLKEIVEITLKEPIDLFKGDHFQLLAALDDHEEQFSENQQIKTLKRCNERLIWCSDNYSSEKGCSKCFENINETDKHHASSAENFDGLLECRPHDERDRFDLYCSDYEFIMHDAEEQFTRHLERHSLQNPHKKALHFVGLQRWNSLTPAQGRSVGGGYFIYRTNSEDEVDLGIAIDPGFDYVRNLFRMGFSLMDVDIVLISHAHPDHLWDFESMVQLLNDLKVKKGITHRLNVVLTLGSYQRLEHIIKNPKLRRFINPLVIDIRKEIEHGFFNKLGTDTDSEKFNYCFAFDDANGTKKNTEMMRWYPVLPNDKKHNVNSEIEIWPTRAYHDDYSERSDSFGFLINVTTPVSSGINGKKFCFGYTGDTKWVGNDLYNQACPADDNDCEKKCCVDSPRWKDVADQYADCDVLLMHLGSLINHKKKGKERFRDYPSAKFCEKLIREKNHPYLMGMIRFLRELYNSQPAKKKLILMGEFGEELRGGIRIDLVKRLQRGLTKTWPIVPVDVGLDILLHDYADPEPKEDSPQFSKFKFMCALCDKPRPLSEIGYFRFGTDEAIFYICKTCNRAFPDDVRQTKLRHLYEIGRELRTHPPNRADHA